MKRSLVRAPGTQLSNDDVRDDISFGLSLPIPAQSPSISFPLLLHVIWICFTSPVVHLTVYRTTAINIIGQPSTCVVVVVCQISAPYCVPWESQGMDFVVCC